MEDELFQELLTSVKQGAAIMKGALQPRRTFEFPETEVRALRKQFGLTQDKFAHLMGIGVGTLRNWEQGRRRPEGAARVLLRVASTHPEALLEVAAERAAETERATDRSTAIARKRAAG
ncbi:MAG: helix-turn-helix domain-containing protein [Thermoleophilia bacterium]